MSPRSIVIDEKSDTIQKIEIDFIFSEFRVVVSLPTYDKLIKFSKKIIPDA